MMVSRMNIVDIGDTIIAPLSIYNNKERFLLLKRLKMAM